MSTPDFTNTLNAFDKFVKEVLNGRNSFEKRKLSEKIHQLNQLCHVSKKRKTESILSKTDVTGNVPNEIWLKVISYLKCKDIFLGFGQVCTRFNDLTHEPTAIKFFELNEKILSAPGQREVSRILKHSKSLKSIVLKSRNALHDVFIEEALTSNPQLKSVTIFNASIWGKDSHSTCKKIVDCLTEAESITHLEILDGCEGFDSKLLMKIADMKNLKTLRLNLRSKFSLNKGIDFEFIEKISVNCINLETIELNNFNLDNPHEIQIAFDKFFKERKDTLKSFILSQSTYDEDNVNILRNLSLCENLEELSTDNHDYVLTQLPKIAKMHKIKRLMLTWSDNPERFERLINFFNEARFPMLERLSIEEVKHNGENIEQVQLFSDASLKSFLEKSPSLKSIHFLGINFEHDIWNISNELLFQIIKDSNIFINFGKIKIAYDSKIGMVLSAKDKNQKRQLSLEQYLLDHDMSVFNKYQKMKAEFSIWFKERSNWHSFDCINELHKEN